MTLMKVSRITSVYGEPRKTSLGNEIVRSTISPGVSQNIYLKYFIGQVGLGHRNTESKDASPVYKELSQKEVVRKAEVWGQGHQWCKQEVVWINLREVQS